MSSVNPVKKHASLLCTAGFILICFGSLFFFAGSWQGVVDFCNGERISLDESMCDLGTIECGKSIPVSIPLRNLTFSKIEVLGFEADCNCYAVNTKFPLAIDFMSEEDFSIQFNPPTEPGVEFVKNFSFIGSKMNEKFHFQVRGKTAEN